MDKNGNNMIFDINKICDFVFGDPNERTSEVEITEHFGLDEDEDKMVPIGREVKEVKTSDYTGKSTIRYDMIKMFIEILDSIEDPNIMSLGQKMTINTMESYELIKDLNEN